MSNENDIFKIAIMSDMHVGTTEEDKENTWLTTSAPDNHTNPITTLEELIEEKKISANILLNCGDMSIKAEFSSQEYAWDKTNQLGEKINAKVMGTIGNHDVDSMCKNSDYDVKGGLQSLNPPFPGLDDSYGDKYWSRNYAIKIIENVRILNINSCAYHGVCSDKSDKKEFMHGRVSIQTIDSIKKELEKDQNKYDLNICFFHHHIDALINCKQTGDYSAMIKGEELIEAISSSSKTNWLLIHGHKHCPNIQEKKTTDGMQHIIFSAGSFSSKRPKIDTNIQQFYIIEAVKNSLEKNSLPISGQIKAWTYGYGEGWLESTQEAKICYGMGFGFTEDIRVLAKKIDKVYLSYDEKYCEWAEIMKKIPNLDYISNSNLHSLIDTLEREYNYVFHLERNNGMISQMAKGEN